MSGNHTLIVYGPYEPDLECDRACTFFSGDIDDILKPQGFSCCDFSPEESVSKAGWRHDAAVSFLNFLAENFDFSVNTEKLTFVFSRRKFLEGFNSILERFRDKRRQNTLSQYAGFEAVADAEIFDSFRKNAFADRPMLYGGFHNHFYSNFYNCMLNNREDGKTFEITQVVSISLY